jgi:phosphoribosylglycinamide formyltransferase-1
MSPEPERLLEKLRALALSLPGVAEKLSHGSPGFYVEGGRFFAYFSHDHHGDDTTSVCVKTSGREEQDMLIEAAPDLYYWPAYIGPAGWIGLRLDQGEPDWEHVEDWLRKSWTRAAPARLRKASEPTFRHAL